MVDIDSCFPHEKMRVEQRNAITFALQAFEQGKRFVVLEMGTGTGKSATGLTIANCFHASNPTSRAHFLTTQKILQQQYVDDFGEDVAGPMRSVKSSNNYTCSYYSDQSCAESRRLLTSLKKQFAGTAFQQCCSSNCVYAKAKRDYLDARASVTNFSYFLAETMYMADVESTNKIGKRDLLIVDEAHNIADELSKFIEVTFSEKFCKDVLKCKMPSFTPTTESSKIFAWVKKTYVNRLNVHISTLQKRLAALLSLGTDLDQTEFTNISKQHSALDKHVCKVNRFIEEFDSQNWVVNVVMPPADNNRSGRRIEFKPIDVAPYAEQLLYKFGDRVLLMSATIIDFDVFCRTSGISVESAAYLRIPSPFPPENRPIHVLRAGKMSVNHIDSTLPKIAEIIKMLLQHHENDKGVIHCVSFKVAQYIKNHVDSDRLLIHGSDDRDRVLQRHLMSSQPTVLLSPSMTEGVDLADDASRFQILCKVPFPYLGDKVIQRRKDLDRRWYPFQTVKTIVQAFGRSVRNASDHAESYILDEDWDYFFQINRALFPKEFIDAIVND